MQGVFMGHLSFYNKNQIRDKLLLVLIFAAGEVIEWQGYGIGSEREYTYSRRYGWMKKINRKFLRLIFYKRNPDSGEQETVMSMLLGPRKQENSSM